MNTFQDKVVWITGASSGYGKALAQAFSAAGARLILSARREDRLLELAATLKCAKVLPLDLGETATFPEKCQTAIAVFGHVDILINNGAIAQSGSALETHPDVARKIMEIDYFSHTELTRCVLPHFMARKSGQVVVVSGLLARVTLPGRSSYAAAKAALLGYFGCLRAELAGSGIAVSILVPGALQTDLVAKALKADGTPAGATPAAGYPVDMAAQQSLAAIFRQEFEACIGDDKSAELWKRSAQDPARVVDMFLAQAKV